MTERAARLGLMEDLVWIAFAREIESRAAVSGPPSAAQEARVPGGYRQYQLAE
jgi:hypothetical protein